MEKEKLINKVIQEEEFNEKESRYNVSVLINHHQDKWEMISSVVETPMVI